MDYSISGCNCELLRVELESTEAVIAEVGKMIYTRGAVEWKVVLPGRGLAGKLAAGFERKLSGGSVVSQFGNLDHFSCGFASTAKSGCGMLCAKHMPKGPKGQKRPADVIGNAVTIMKIATGEIDESGETDDGKSKAAVELGRKGGRARASKLTPQQRREIAKKAAAKRWAKD